MKTDWDYTKLADAYIDRPDYAPEALSQIFSIANVKPGDTVCDIGAGVGHLTIPLAKFGLKIDAVEPNDAMRTNGIKRTADLFDVTWSEGTGEMTGKNAHSYDMVTFGSSFNACDRQKALEESWRLLKPGKFFVCLWNHRDLADPIQHDIENIIKMRISDYSYGVRREDQTDEIARSGLFENAQYIEGRIVWKQPVEKVIEAWKSHATLMRQAGDNFSAIIADIQRYLTGINSNEIEIPYTTRVWMAKKKG